MYVFITAVHSGILGALLTFSPDVLFPAYSASTAAWGLTPIEDQQLGGLIMWIPAGAIYIIAGLLLFAGWMREAESRARRREGRVDALSGEV
jgi:putative membrane protein